MFSVPSRCARNPGLWATVSALALSPQGAFAADHQASDEASLKTAIQAVNADTSGAVSITLTADIAVTDPTNMPALTKVTTLNTGGHMLTGATVNESAQLPTAPVLTVVGGGEIHVTGTGTVASNFQVMGSTVQLESGGKLSTATTQVDAAGATSSSMLVSGAGSKLTAARLILGDMTGLATFRIENGGAATVGSAASERSPESHAKPFKPLGNNGLRRSRRSEELARPERFERPTLRFVVGDVGEPIQRLRFLGPVNLRRRNPLVDPVSVERLSRGQLQGPN
jgi:T5SS/PEP-CTERM-associated repeat protein